MHSPNGLARIEPWLWIAPALVILALFTYLPLLTELALSLSDSEGLGVPRFIGLQNYYELLHDTAFGDSLLISLKFVVCVVFLKVGLSLLVAVLLSGAIRGRLIFRTLFYFPTVVSFVAIGTIWSLILSENSGTFNALLRLLGLGAFTQSWLGNPDYAFSALVSVDVWRAFGFHMVIYLAGILTIPVSLYEAAAIDGAGAFQQFYRITLPLLRRYTAINVTTATLSAFGTFDLVYVMTDGGPVRSTTVAMVQIYHEAFKFNRFGYASAESAVMFFITIIVAVGLMTLLQRRAV